MILEHKNNVFFETHCYFNFNENTGGFHWKIRLSLNELTLNGTNLQNNFRYNDSWVNEYKDAQKNLSNVAAKAAKTFRPPTKSNKDIALDQFFGIKWMNMPFCLLMLCIILFSTSLVCQFCINQEKLLSDHSLLNFESCPYTRHYKRRYSVFLPFSKPLFWVTF